jgi:hypothetical protein
MQFSPFSCHLIPLRPKYPPQHPVLKHPQSMCLNARHQVSHPYRTAGKIIVLFVLIFTFFDSRQLTNFLLNYILSRSIGSVWPWRRVGFGLATWFIGHSQLLIAIHYTRCYHQFSQSVVHFMFMLTAGPRDQFPRWRRSRSRLPVSSILRCPARSVITVQREFRARVKNAVLSVPCTKLRLHCITDLGISKRSTFLLRRHLGNWPRNKHEKRTAGSAWGTWTVPAADWLCCASVGREMNMLIKFDNAPFVCVWPVQWQLIKLHKREATL